MRSIACSVLCVNWYNFFGASVELMQVLASACGHDHLSQFNRYDIISWKKEVCDLSGIEFAGFDVNR